MFENIIKKKNNPMSIDAIKSLKKLKPFISFKTKILSVSFNYFLIV
jgi:hypothetical protein